MPFSFRDFCNKTENISLFVYELSSGRTSTMSLIDINSYKDGPIDFCGVAGLVLEFGDVLVGMKWHNSIVVVAGRDEHGWVLLFLDVVKWRPVDQEVECALLVWVAVFRLPEVATGELVEPKHVRHWHLWNSTSKKLRSLVRGNSNERTAIRSA